MRRDITLDNNNDLQIVDGDFLVSVSDEQNIELLLISCAGQWKQYPLVGANIKGDINGLFNDVMKNTIKQQLVSDGYNSVTFKFDQSTANINIKLNQ
jgi:hypothetical protein